jgi:hypothetical protein
VEKDVLFSGFGRLRPKPEKYNGLFFAAAGGKAPDARRIN